MTKGFLFCGGQLRFLPTAGAFWRVVRSVLPVFPVAALGLVSCEGCRSSPVSDARSAAPDVVGPPSVRLYLLTDVAGALEPCGCTRDQLGGLDHFGAWLKANAGDPSSLVAAAGPLFFMDESLTAEHRSQDRAKADTMARVFHDVGFAAFAPGANDWADGPTTLTDLANASGGTAILAEAGSGAVAPTALPKPPFAPWVLRRLEQPGGSSVTVGFVGYGQSSPGESGTKVGSVEETVARGAAAAKAAGANILIALAAVGRGEAKRIADAVPDLSAVVVGSRRSAGDANTTAPPAEQVGDVLIVEAANHLQSVAVLDLYVRGPAAPGKLLRFADATGLSRAAKRQELAGRIDELRVRIASWEGDRSVSASDITARKHDLAALESERDGLDSKAPPATGSFFRYAVKEVRDSLGKDPAIEAEFRAYYKAVNDRNRVDFASRVPTTPGPGEASYVGIETCTGCHPGPRAVWNATAHARAYGTLATQFKEFNLDCVSCHVTGYEKPGGSTVTHVDGLRDVQCEVCHGPGSEHVRNPSDKSAITAAPSPALCVSCHHSPHVEGFDPTAKLALVLGPGHGLPLR